MSSEQFLPKPDIKLSVKQTFGFDSEMKVGSFSKKNDYVPKIDPDYKFDKDTTLAILAGFWCRNPPKMVPKLDRKRVFERTRCCSTFLHDFCMFCVLFPINFLDAFLLGLLAFFPDFLYFLKTAEVHFGVTSSRILRSGRVSTRERFSNRFAKIHANRYEKYLQHL